MLVSKKSILADHMKTKKHRAATTDLGSSSNQSHIEFQRKRIDKSVQIAEARIALLVAKHTSINVVDHISKTIKVCFSDSTAAVSFQLSRTKCSAVIRNVWCIPILKPNCKTTWMVHTASSSTSQLTLDQSSSLALC